MAPDRTSATVDIVLSCSHVNTYPKPNPIIGQEVWCRKCNDYRSVTEAANSPFHVKCRDCTMGGRFGSDGLTAGRRAASHLRKRPSHTVDVYQGEKLAHTLTSETPSLFGEQLRAVSADNQRLLRAFMESAQNGTE